MLLKKFLILASVVAAWAGFAANKTYYVDSRMQDYTGHDGSSWVLAYETIQQAIDKAGNDDTILVKPGLYNKGEGSQVKSWGASRIGWNSKRLYITATSSNPADTIIEGQQDFDSDVHSAEGNGTNTMHCVCVYHYDNTTHGSIIKGFTFRKGGTQLQYNIDSPKHPGNALQIYATLGGAVCVATARFYFADCVFEDNSGYDGILHCGSYIRCRFTNNNQRKGATMFHGGTDNGVKSTFYACVIDHNWNSHETSNIQSGIMCLGADFYNCTVIENWFATFLYNSGTTANNCLFWNAGALNTSNGVKLNNCLTEGTVKRPIMSTIFADIRLISDTDAVTAGDATLNANITIPADVFTKVGKQDYLGDTIPETGTIAVGASQQTMTPQYGGLATLASNTHLINGIPCKYGTYTYVFPEFYPTQYCYSANADSLADGYRLSNIHFLQTSESVEAYDYRFPDMNDNLWVMPPMTAGVVLTNDAFQIAKPVYVDPNADASIADGSSEKPYRTLQTALNSGKTVIVAKEGTYGLDDDDVTTHDNVRARIVSSGVQRITSEKGAEKTFIVGKKDTSSDADEYGRGPAAVRCIFHCGNMTQLQGFTLTGGYTDKVNSSWRGKGGAACSNCEYLHLDDCIVTNNYAMEGAGVLGGRITRTYVADNFATDYAIADCRIIGSVVGTNTLVHFSNGALGSSCKTIHSTIISEKKTNHHPYCTSMSRRFATVFLGGDTANNYGTAVGNVYSDMLKVTDTTGGVAADALLTDPDNGDYAPMAISPVFTAAPVVSAANGYDKYYVAYSPCYFDGTPVMSGSAKPVAGAFQTVTPKSVVAVKAEKGGISVSASRTFLGEEESLSIAQQVELRPCNAVTVNGVTNNFAEVNPIVITAADAKGGVSVVALYDNKWYVDATNGNNSNSGFTANSAKKTLAAICNPEALLSGDIIYAAEGVYNDGEMAGDKGALKVRISLPAGVSLVASGRQSETIIEGKASDTSDEWTYYATDDMRGMGPSAVKGVLMHSGCLVKGFTFRKCYGRGKDITGVAYEDQTGGAISAQDEVKNNAIVEDCFFTNNASFRGGAAFGLKCVRCEFVDNVAVYGGGATSDAELYDCLTRNNKANFPWSVYQQGNLWNYICEGCTIMDSVSKPGLYPDSLKQSNTIVSGYFEVGATTAAKTSNSYFVKNRSNYSAEWLAETTSHEVATVDDLYLDADGTPTPRLSPVVDQYGDFTSTYTASVDVYGNQRVANGARDIGAVEADWKAYYSKDLHRRVTTVTAASSMVKEVGDTTKTIQLTDGAELQVTVLKANYPFAFPITVENGTLSITVGDTTTNYTSSQTVTLDKSSTDRELVFAFTANDGEGDKLATVGGFKSQVGAVIFLQ